jgi:hypothetical protein
MVDEIARRVRDNFPAGRNVWVELSNETWRNWNAMAWFNPVTRMVYPGSTTRIYYLQRTREVVRQFTDRFNEGGRGRSGEIKTLIGVCAGFPPDTQQLLAAAQILSPPLKVDGVACACYIDCSGDASSVAAYGAFDTAQCVDLWIHDFATGVTSANQLTDHRVVLNYIAAYNAATGYNCVLYGYEGGTEGMIPSAVVNSISKARDVIYHPNFYFVEQDMYALWQQLGYYRMNIYGMAIAWVNATNCWGMYHHPQQDHGRGDGSDGKADNRLCMAQPGLPNSKPAAVNQDQHNVSVRGQAFIDWLKSAR